MQTGSCKFGLWRLIVSWDKTIVHQVQFVRTAPAGDVPVQFTRYLAGRSDSFAPFTSAAAAGTTTYARIYRAVAEIPYGETRTYRDAADTHPRVVGNAMAHNPTALLIPCHRVVAADGSLGGFTPDILIKKELLKLEAEHKASFEKSGT